MLIRRLLTGVALGATLVAVTAAGAADVAKPRFAVYGNTLTDTPMTEGGVKYTMRTVKWPTGTVRVMNFTKAAGVMHKLTDETEIFVLKGSVTATVNGSPVVLKTGDVASHATGVLKTGDAEDTQVISWTVGSLTPDAKPAVVRAADAPEAGNPEVLKVKRYEFPGNSIRVATMVAGSKNGPTSAKTDSLIYIKEGHVRFIEGDETHDLHAGDFVWEEAGVTHRWEHADGGSFVTTTGIPKGAAPMTPAEAVDRPEMKK